MGRLDESAEIDYFPASDRDAQVAGLDNPWIGDEGPLEASFRRGTETEPLQLRGLAFDRETTVVWDEDAVQVVRAKEAEPGVIALSSPVIVRERFPAPAKLARTDYLRDGALIASRYTAEDPGQGATDA